MKIFKIIIFVFVLLNYAAIAQKFSSEDERIDVENILNAVINSAPFDSVYSHNQVYFLANELITENSTLILKKNECKVKILNEEKVKKVKQYVVLGDFTLDWDNRIAVRVQLSISPNITLNMRLEKENEIWIIKNHIIFYD
jgi:hypothetical protein